MAVPGGVQMDVDHCHRIPENACGTAFGDVDIGTAFGADRPALSGNSADPKSGAFSISEIAEETGIGKSTLYRHLEPRVETQASSARTR